MPSARNLISIDLGSSGLRLHLGELGADGRLTIETVAAFENGPVQVGARWYWDVLRLWSGLGAALAGLAPRLDGPATLSIASFGVDYVLVDTTGAVIAGPRHMRDPRTRGVPATAYATLSKADLYRRTGSMEIEINTLFQLLADRRDQPWLFDVADALALIPDHLGRLLSGRRFSEISIASTTQLVDPRTRDWDSRVIEAFGLPRRLFAPIVESGTVIGPLAADEARRLGFTVPVAVVAAASHDTASAAAAIPYEEGASAAFISLGTWSLVGRERAAPDLSDLSRDLNFTNECGVAGRTVHHKIQAGLWLAQEVRRRLTITDPDFDFATFEKAAAASHPLAFVFDADDPLFRDPDDMIAAIAAWFGQRGEPAPTTLGEIARAIYDSLALSYVDTIVAIERLTGDPVAVIHVVGGGAGIPTLVQAIADATGRRVVAGPVEATVIGNFLAQLVARGAVADFESGRRLVAASTAPTPYEPHEPEAWRRAHRRLAERKSPPPAPRSSTERALEKGLPT
ncbi:rhamnulokinase [Siculibacillus lacustris]|uniref:Rhamnulokinase n=1 Tax=Siculibacillus lacustris TaxID=1549641 RepID=A0A4Q9VJJ0_9HYPH|nr:FGGY-family carbohydrate kinase [Siculibacillus lacustris]TBW35507.1 rhamnulokinase [Siculibacillus lacustris]